MNGESNIPHPRPPIQRPRSAASAPTSCSHNVDLTDIMRRRCKSAGKRPVAYPHPVVFHESHGYLDHKLRGSTPGPAAYVPMFDKSRNGGYIAQAGRFNDACSTAVQMKPCDTPGPAMYSQEPPKTTKVKIRFRGSNRKPLYDHALGVPGPGKYNPNDPSTRSTPRIKFATARKRDAEIGSKPGPGDYQNSVDFIPNGPKWVMGKTIRKLPYEKEPVRRKKKVDLLSECDDMTVNKSFGVFNSGAPTFSKSARMKAAANEGFPGPGAYDTVEASNVIHPNDPVVSFVKSKRPSLHNLSNYSAAPPHSESLDPPQAHQRKGCTFSKANRFFNFNQHLPVSSPGPAMYNTSGGDVLTKKRSSKSVISFESGGRTSMNVSSNTNPSPNSYNPTEVTTGKMKGISVAHSSRVETSIIDSPGPGTYTPEGGIHSRKGIKWKTCSQSVKRDPFGCSSSATAAPFYDVSDTLNQSLGMTFPKQGREYHSIIQAPGPACYCPAFRQTQATSQTALLYLTG